MKGFNDRLDYVIKQIDDVVSEIERLDGLKTIAIEKLDRQKKMVQDLVREAGLNPGDDVLHFRTATHLVTVSCPGRNCSVQVQRVMTLDDLAAIEAEFGDSAVNGVAAIIARKGDANHA